jgi:hypothetical protein
LKEEMPKMMKAEISMKKEEMSKVKEEMSKMKEEIIQRDVESDAYESADQQ